MWAATTAIIRRSETFRHLLGVEAKTGTPT
jgi:hypothetical protein